LARRVDCSRREFVSTTDHVGELADTNGCRGCASGDDGTFQRSIDVARADASDKAAGRGTNRNSAYGISAAKCDGRMKSEKDIAGVRLGGRRRWLAMGFYFLMAIF
jgi:hypothetical protein